MFVSVKVRYSDSLVEELYLPVEQITFDSDASTPLEDSTALELDASLACFEVCFNHVLCLRTNCKPDMSSSL